LETLLGDDVGSSGRYLPELIYGANDGIVTTFAAFIVAGWAPLFPSVLGVEPLFPVSIAVTAAAFFAVGASRSLVTNRSWLANGVEMFVVGMAAATVAYAVGNLLAGVA